jgi:hypothetical protein
VRLDAIEWDQVRRLTLVPFLADGRCALIPMAGRLVPPGGRLLASHYVPAGDRSRHPAELLARLGFQVDGVTAPGDSDGRAVPPTAWLTQRG